MLAGSPSEGEVPLSRVDRPTRVTYPEAEAFITANREEYLRLISELKDLLNRLRRSKQGRKSVYLVYSRGDKQADGDEIKKIWEFKEKVNRLRQEEYDRLAGVGTLHDYSDLPLEAVKDVVGLTVVCPHPEDTRIVRTYLETLEREGRLRLDQCVERRERGYRAIHCAVALVGAEPDRLLCEVQIKTILADAWTAWTHDLTYKPVSIMPPGLEDHMEYTGDLLTTLDDQSEFFRRQVDEEWAFETSRKRASRTQLLRRVMYATPPKRDPERYEAITRRIENLGVNPESDSLRDLRTQIDKYAEGTWDFDACRLVTLLAAMQEEIDLHYYAFARIDEWATSLTDRAHESEAIAFLAFAAWCFNHLDVALRHGERALKAAEQSADEVRVVRYGINLAHYLAEQGAARGLRHQKWAEELLEDIWPERASDLEAREKDSIGFVKIVFGRSRDEVEEGLEICTQAYEQRESGDEAARLFFEHHKRLAEKRLAHLP